MKIRRNGPSAVGYPILDSLDSGLQEEIEQYVGKQPRAFYAALATHLSYFKGERDYDSEVATKKESLDILKFLQPQTRALHETLSELDRMTRRRIREAEHLRTDDPVTESIAALEHLSKAIDAAIRRIKPRAGRRYDHKQNFADSVFQVFSNHGLNPTTTRGGSFEKCLGLLLASEGAATGEANLHQLTVASAKKVKNHTPKSK